MDFFGGDTSFCERLTLCGIGSGLDNGVDGVVDDVLIAVVVYIVIGDVGSRRAIQDQGRCRFVLVIIVDRKFIVLLGVRNGIVVVVGDGGNRLGIQGGRH